MSFWRFAVIHSVLLLLALYGLLVASSDILPLVVLLLQEPSCTTAHSVQKSSIQSRYRKRRARPTDHRRTVYSRRMGVHQQMEEGEGFPT